MNSSKIEFRQITEKGLVLAEHLNVPAYKIIYVPIRNIFVDIVNKEEYNVLFDEERYIQAEINLKMELEDGDTLCNLYLLSVILDVDLTELKTNLDAEQDDYIEYNDKIWELIKSKMTLDEYIKKYARVVDLSSILDNSNYEEPVILGNFYIYHYQEFSGFN